MAYRIAEVNSQLWRVYDGDELVGQVRQGLDHGWYPELPAQAHRTAAVQQVMLADQAVREFLRALHA